MAQKTAQKKNKFKIEFLYDDVANTFTIWLNDKSLARTSSMDRNDDIIIMDKNKRAIGVEKLDFLPLNLYQKFIQAQNKSIEGKLSLACQQ